MELGRDSDTGGQVHWCFCCQDIAFHDLPLYLHIYEILIGQIRGGALPSSC